MIKTKLNHYCWFCGHLLDPNYENDVPAPPRFFLTCPNHEEYFVTFIASEDENGSMKVDFIDIFDKREFIDRLKNFPIIYFYTRTNSLRLWKDTFESEIILPISLLNNQPEVIVKKVNKLMMLL